MLPPGPPPNTYPGLHQVAAAPGYGPLPPPPANSLIRLRPLEIGDLFDEIFRVYRRHFTLFAGISVAVVIPALLIQYFLGSFGQLSQTVSVLDSIAQGSRPTPVTPPDINWVGVLISSLLNIAVYPFSIGALVFATCELGEGRRPTWRSVFGGVLRNYWAIFAVGLIFGLATLLIVVPPIWVWIAVGWSVALPVLFVERRGIYHSLGRSWDLVEGRWWRTFLLLLLVLLLLYVVEIALGAFATSGILLSFFLPQIVAGVVVYTLSDVLRAVAAPVFYIAIVLVYYDLRVRREGIDLVQQAQNLVRPHGPASGPLPS